MASFLNNKGGVLLIGVADDGTVVGVENDIARLHEKSRDSYVESFTNDFIRRLGKFESSRVGSSFHEVDGKVVFAIKIPQGVQAAYALDTENGQHKQRLYVRAGNTCQTLEGKDAEQYIKNHWSP
ncbi:helix-turn-helix domain-containing protein [Corallococcus terminator]